MDIGFQGIDLKMRVFIGLQVDVLMVLGETVSL